MQTDTTEQSGLPSYKRPPVTEVVLGVQFNRLEQFSAVHPGIYFERNRCKYPNFRAQPPLSESCEEFGVKKGIEISLPMFMNSPPVPRCWFVSEDDSRIVQLQDTRFIYNWRQVTGEEEYPRYKTIQREFAEAWDDFQKFAIEQELGEVTVNHWEVTYVNQIGKDTLNKLGSILKYWSERPSNTYLPTPESFAINCTYAFPEKLGRLYLSVHPAISQHDSKEITVMKLTAKGKYDRKLHKDIYGGLDLGREWIVRGFTDLTTVKAQKVWGREDVTL